MKRSFHRPLANGAPLALTLGIATVVLALPATAGEPALAAEKTSRIDSVFHDYDRKDEPGCAVGVMHGTSVSYVRYFGLADMENPAPLNATTVFNIGSISKQFTAFAILLLEQDGKLHLSDDIRRFLPEMPEYEPLVTIEHLLRQTSGIRDGYELLKMQGRHIYADLITADDILALAIRQEKLNFPPGAEYSYSNSNYSLLGLIVERASGRRFSEFVKERIFAPLGMRRTVVRDDSESIVPGRALGYARPVPGPLKSLNSNEAVVGDGNIFASIEDFARWNGNFSTAQVGGRALLQRMTTPLPSEGQASAYALGLEAGKHGGFKTVEHGGAFAGYRAYFLRFPEKDAAVAVFCNVRDATRPSPRSMATQVADIAFDIPVATPSAAAPQNVAPSSQGPQASAAELKRYAGRYFSDKDGAVLAVEAAGGALVVTANFLAKDAGERLEATGHDQFRNAQGESLLFSSQDGKRSLTVRSADGTATPYVGVSGPRAAFGEFAGTFTSDEAAATWTFEERDGALHLNIPRFPPEKLVPVFEDGFYADQWTLVFRRDRQHVVNGLLVTNERVRAVKFKKSASPG